MIDLGAVFIMAAVALLVIVYITVPFRVQNPEDTRALVERWIREERNHKDAITTDSMLVCPYCGEPVKKKDRFCSNCGKKLLKDENEN